ncbi:polyketide synthase [Crocosphaera subtropica ATCC 51142]|uniref:Polyketide synthase n=1 Tax=Crocosphaera subtropica (strain ATCC 51142 / BH68) TaxID=43989 RepID=B1WWV7_CROS5|nr:type I polyketide synthase [Crocosphaera subtropica]ACB52426.1 polyketide synthase [Crocosphaera subtropica ATCC 51142]
MNHELSDSQRVLLALKQARLQLETLERQKNEPIAIIGMDCRFPGDANSPEAYWELLRNGVDGITDIPGDRWNVETYYDSDPDVPGKMYTRYGGFIDGVDQFDPQFFGISPREAMSLDPQQRLLLEVSYTALERAGQPLDSLEGSKTGVFMGICFDDYSRLSLNSGDPTLIDAYSSLGNTRSIAVGRIAYVLGLQGPVIQLDTTCSSSLLAVHLACQSLRTGESNLALAGGVNLMLSPEVSIGFSKLKALAPDGRCKTFDQRADGYGRGEGCGIVVLKRLSDAIADGDTILATVLGSAVNHDGQSNGLTAPNGSAQEAVIRQALENAKVDPTQIQYVETHGTGTSLGDPIEVLALSKVLGEGRKEDNPINIGSVKTNFGHLESAAGVASLIKVILSLQHQEIPPHLHFQTPNPYIPWHKLPVTVPTTLTPWEVKNGRRLAGVSSFGMSGTNVHLIVGESAKIKENIETPKVDRPLHLLTLSAKTETALQAQIEQYKTYLTTHKNLSFADICFSVNKKRSHFDYRLNIIASCVKEASEKLNNSLPPAFSRLVKGGKGVSLPIAFLFTGQGSQYMGMGQQLYQTQPTFKATFDYCCDILQSYLGWDLREILFATEYPHFIRGGRGGSPASSLHSTINTQPALFVIEYALAKLWLSWGIKPNIMIGHSIGEYVAATLAGVFSLEDGLKLITARAQLMQALPETGSMVAVFATLETVKKAINSYSEKVSIAAVNHDKNIVISGENEAIKEIISKLELDGIQTQTLNVSHAFHCPMMEPMLEEFEVIAKQINYSSPKLKLVSTVTGTVITDEIATYKYWCEQIRQPVKFAQGMECLGKEGIEIFLEIGPKPTLLNLGQIILEAHRNSWLASLHPKQENWQTMLSSLGQLYIKGCSINWDEFDKDYPRNHLNNLPTYPFQKQRFWLEAKPNRSFIVQQRQHPLLGQKINLAASKTIYFRNNISENLPAFLTDHRVFNTAIFPAAGFLEMGLAAGINIFKSQECYLENVVIQQGLVLPSEITKAVQVNLIPETVNDYRFEIYSLNNEQDQDNDWSLNASGKLKQNYATPSSINLTEEKERFSQGIKIENYYQQCQERGINYGKHFQGIKHIYKLEKEAFAYIELPLEIINSSAYQIHPILLDNCLQVAGIVLTEENSQDTYLPIGLESLTAYSNPQKINSSKVYTYAKINTDKNSIDLKLFSETEQAIAIIKGLQLKKASPTTLLGKEKANTLDNWFYRVKWQKQPLFSNTLLTPKNIESILFPQLQKLKTQPDIINYQNLLSQLEIISFNYILEAFEKLGFKFIQETRFTTTQLREELGILPSYHRLCDRLLNILAEEGILQKIEEEWEVIEEAEVRRQEAEGFLNDSSAELTLLKRCGSQLAEVLRGDCDPVQLLFPEGDLTLTTQLYQESTGSKMMNNLVKQAVLTALDKKDLESPLKILEIGAGTGGTTAYLLPELDKFQTEYVFTDISLLFTKKACQQFKAYSFVEYRLLDIEKDPKTQGFSLQHYDIIIAANVLHATQDLQQTLSHVKQLLTPQGMLVLLEGTRPLRWLDLIFGLTEGWWRFTDTSLRPSYPLLSAYQWQQLLKKSGFAESTALFPDSDPNSLLSQQGVIVAKNAENIDADGKNWLILGDRQGIASQLVQILESQGKNCIIAYAEKTYQQLGQQDYQINPQRPQDWQRLLSKQSFEHIIYLWGLDTPSEEDLTLETLETISENHCLSILHLIQHSYTNPPRLWLVTKGTIATDDDDLISGIAQSSLWGLGKAIALEHPEFNCVCLDLDANTPLKQQIKLLLDEISSNSPENQIAFRKGTRHVARLVPQKLPTLPQPLKLTITQRGTLEKLQWQPLTRRSPKPGEVEIRVKAAGLNFRDVLNALDLYPGEAGPLGCECVGEIINKGENVENLDIGQEVMAIASGSFSHYVTVDAAMVSPKPAALTLEEAATIPVTFLTAHYTLHHLAKIKKGDRILIHAGAGGVGQAAIQIAQQAGAEVFATASIGKWDTLKQLGVRHIMNSRTLDFAEEILAITEGEGVDIVLNSLSGEFISQSLAVLKDNGRFIEIGKSLEAEGRFEVDMLKVCQEEPELVQSMLRHLMEQFQTGQLKPLSYQVFPREEAISAFRYMQQAKHTGKVVVSLGESQISSTENFSTASTLKFREDGTYLITGGLGGLGLLVAQWMVEKGARNLVLMGRNQPNTTQKQKIQALKALGANIIVAQGDVSNQEQLEAILQNIETASPAPSASSAPLKGIIHAAGVLDDGVLKQLTWERFNKVMSPKVQGAWNLHTLSQDKPLDFFVLFSSAASLLGSPGQANHVTANTFLDTLAHYRRSQGLPALSMNWGVWSDIGAAAKRQVNRQGVGAIAPSQGIASLEQLMKDSMTQVGVVPINWNKFLQFNPNIPFFANFKPKKAKLAENKNNFLQQLQTIPPEDKRDSLKDYIRSEVAQVLGFNPSDINMETGFFDLGMDSLTSMEFKNRLQNSFGCTLPSTLAFDYPTGEALVNYLATEVLKITQDTDPPPEEDNTEDLSQDDIADLLAQELLEIKGGEQ